MSALASARLIVCERSGRWAVALRRELAGAGVRVWETRSLADGWDELTKSPASFLIAEQSHDLVALLHGLTRLPRTFPAARAAIVSERSLASYEWLLREAGAVEFLCSPREVGPLARMACRHLAQAPSAPQSLTERIWSTLPWGRDEGGGMKDE